MTALTWDRLKAAASVYDLEVQGPDGLDRMHATVTLVSTVGMHRGQPLVVARTIDLPGEDADRVLRAMVGAAITALGPSAPLEAEVEPLGLTVAEAGDLADLAELLETGRG